MSASRHTLFQPTKGRYLCTICHEPLKIETAKTDEDGRAVHEQCYVDKSSGKFPPKSRKAPGRES